MQVPENILFLIEKYHAGTATPEEKLLLDEWYHSFDDSEVVLTVDGEETESRLAARIKDRLFESIRRSNGIMVAKPARRWQAPAAAAVILLLLCAGTYFLLLPVPARQEVAMEKPIETKTSRHALQGTNKALLTLADGSSIVLDNATNGTISQQGNIRVQKLESGLLAYTVNGRQVTEEDEAFFNTISTPRGSQYQVTLSDQTKIWLNAGSSIRFPVAFAGHERKVEITGEVYFEVTENKFAPFKVKANTSEIEVLGTHFNVNAYKDEPFTKTTLLEGKVKVSVPENSSGNAPKILLPGQQAGINKEGLIRVVDHADTEEAMAWMNGYFQFKSADLKTILRQISRWYDVNIEYHGNVDLHFTGQLTRDQDVNKVFTELSLTGEVHFRMEGKKVIVSP